jgi:5'-deoxynucleotidase YfbR-like HD superfamily hydrolase
VVRRQLRQLLVSGPTRLCYTYRFTGCHVTHQENVAEHSWMTSIFAMAIAYWYNTQHSSATHKSGLCVFCVDPREVVFRAVLHDAEEATTGDLPRPFKYSSPTFKAALDAMAAPAFDLTFGGCVGADTLQKMRQVWQLSKDDSYAGRIVEFADFLTVVSFATREGAGGNTMLRDHLGDLPRYARKFQDARFDFIRPWTVAAFDEVVGVVGTESQR